MGHCKFLEADESHFRINSPTYALPRFISSKMSINDSLSNPSSGSLVTRLPHGDQEFPLHYKEEDELPPWSTLDLHELADGFQDNAIESTFTKLEASDYDSSRHSEIQNTGIDSTSVDVKVAPVTSSWHPSKDFMNIVLGEDSSALGFNIRLDDDVYLVANKESQSNIFPV